MKLCVSDAPVDTGYDHRKIKKAKRTDEEKKKRKKEKRKKKEKEKEDKVMFTQWHVELELLLLLLIVEYYIQLLWYDIEMWQCKLHCVSKSSHL